MTVRPKRTVPWPPERAVVRRVVFFFGADFLLTARFGAAFFGAARFFATARFGAALFGAARFAVAFFGVAFLAAARFGAAFLGADFVARFFLIAILYTFCCMWELCHRMRIN
jgi:hypothetical protein